METEASNKLGAYHNFFEPKDEGVDVPLKPHWPTSMQACYNSGSTPTPLLNVQGAGLYSGHYVWPNQANSTMLQYEFLHDHVNQSNNSIVAGAILTQQQQSSTVPLAKDASTIFSEKIQTMFGANNMNSMKGCDGSLRSKSSKTKKPRENENNCSAASNDKDGLSASGASESKESPDESHGTTNVFPSTKKRECYVELEKANSTENGLNASDSAAQLTKDEDEIRKERKRQSNRESAKRSRMRKQKECEELHRNTETLRGENSALTQRLQRLSEECLELRYENDLIEEELVRINGEESVADLLPMKPV